jgi:hypothetical protein
MGMEQKTNYKIMKLKSGEEIIARIKNSTDKKIIIERPMCFRSLMIQDYNGNPKEILVMKNWIPLSVENIIDIPKDHILSFMNPNPDAISLYEAEKEREDTKFKITEFKKEIIDEDDEFKKMMKFLSDNTQKLDDMMKDIEQVDEKKPQAKQNKDDMIFMNMMFPPEMLIDLIESELIDPELFGEMYKDIKKSKKKKPLPPKNKKSIKKNFSEGNSGKYTGDQTNHKDFGNRWTDWNPDLSSDEYK